MIYHFLSRLVKIPRFSLELLPIFVVVKRCTCKTRSIDARLRRLEQNQNVSRANFFRYFFDHKFTGFSCTIGYDVIEKWKSYFTTLFCRSFISFMLKSWKVYFPLLYLRVTKKNEHCPRLATACRQLVEAAVVTLLIKENSLTRVKEKMKYTSLFTKRQSCIIIGKEKCRLKMLSFQEIATVNKWLCTFKDQRNF